MIETKNDQMTDLQIKQYLSEEMPWLATDTAVAALRGCTANDIANKITRIQEALEYHTHGYKNAYREFLSIYPEAQEGFAFRLDFYRKKKTADEAEERASLINQLKHFRVVDAIGQRLDPNKMPLSELRKNSAFIAENRRQQTLTSDQLRAEEAAKRPAPPTQYKPLPPEITAEELNRILRSSEARRFLRLYGAVNLNARLQGAA